MCGTCDASKGFDLFKPPLRQRGFPKKYQKKAYFITIHNLIISLIYMATCTK